MKKIEITEVNNGQMVRVEGFIKSKGTYVYKATELIAMLEFLGELILGRKVNVTEK